MLSEKKYFLKKILHVFKAVHIILGDQEKKSPTLMTTCRNWQVLTFLHFWWQVQIQTKLSY